VTVSADSFPRWRRQRRGGDDFDHETAAIITCNDSRSRLPVIPAADLPAVLALDFETGSVEISGDACLQLLEPLAAVSTERSRFYLCGIFLPTVGDDLVAVATDGVRLVRVAVPAAAFSASRDLILPSKPQRFCAVAAD
jgi:DNA polymerase-3 subunit beta